jgi:hypothetical protein
MHFASDQQSLCVSDLWQMQAVHYSAATSTKHRHIVTHGRQFSLSNPLDSVSDSQPIPYSTAQSRLTATRG